MPIRMAERYIFIAQSFTKSRARLFMASSSASTFRQRVSALIATFVLFIEFSLSVMVQYNTSASICQAVHRIKNLTGHRSGKSGFWVGRENYYITVISESLSSVIRLATYSLTRSSRSLINAQRFTSGISYATGCPRTCDFSECVRTMCVISCRISIVVPFIF